MTALIITNGDCAADLLVAAGKDGRVVPWRDSLCEGPVAGVATLAEREAFRRLRAGYWAERGVGAVGDMIADYQQRDQLIEGHDEFERIELWFEHDLYDQLQLIEILTRLYHLKRFDDVHLVQAGSYLGMMSPDKILDLEEMSRPVDERMMAIADLAWQTVIHDKPTKLAEFVSLKPAGFPFLAQGLHRLMEELPGREGLSRTERQILYSINRGLSRPGMLFARCQQMEAAQFWGDLGFFNIFSALQFCAAPLIAGLPEGYSLALFQDDERRKAFLQSDVLLTALGKAILAGEDDHAAHNRIERYVGGTKITPENLWRFDAEAGELFSPDAAG